MYLIDFLRNYQGWWLLKKKKEKLNIYRIGDKNSIKRMLFLLSQLPMSESVDSLYDVYSDLNLSQDKKNICNP